MPVIIQRALDSSSSPLVFDIWPDSVSIEPGQTVLIKPNLVLDAHPKGGDVRCLITQGEVVRQILERVADALKGRGRVIVGDSPLQITDFDEAARVSGIQDAIENCRRKTGLDIRLVDFRQVHAVRDKRGHIREWKEVPGDPAGIVTYDLGADSLLTPIEKDSGRFRVSNYRPEDTAQYHGLSRHRYAVAGSAIDADVIISVPKMKTHCKVGVTLSMKNFVGMVCRKQCLAHHRAGGAPQGGDEYPDGSRLKGVSVRMENAIDGNSHPVLREALKLAYRANERLIKRFGVNPIRDGGWHGNDTCWRMTLDLVRIALYGRRDGTMADMPQRKILTVVDGIIAGEGEGPLEATPVEADTLVFGDNPLLTDIFTATLMGFDYRKIPLLREGLRVGKWAIGERSEVGGPKLDQTSELDLATSRQSSRRGSGQSSREGEMNGEESGVACRVSEERTNDTAGEQLAERTTATVNGQNMSLRELARNEMRMNFKPPMGWEGEMELGR